MSLFLPALVGLLIASSAAAPAVQLGSPEPLHAPQAEKRPYGLKAVGGFKWGTTYQEVEAGLKAGHQIVEKDKTRIVATGEYLGFPNCRVNYFFNEEGRLFRLTAMIPARASDSLAQHYAALHRGLSERLQTPGHWNYTETQPAFTQTPVKEQAHQQYTDRVNRGPGYYTSYWALANALVAASSVLANETFKTPYVIVMSEWFQIEPAADAYIGLETAL